MIGLRRSLLVVLVLVWALVAAPMVSRADASDPSVIDVEVLGTVELPDSQVPTSLVVQATSWLGDPYAYILTLSNLSPWPLGSLTVLDRYFPDDPVEEISHDWFPDRIEPGEAASIVIPFPDGPFVDGCHQLEIGWAEGWSVVLMDCNGPGTMTVWEVPLSEEMASYLAEPSPYSFAPISADRSRLGLHVTRNSTPAIMDFVEEMQPAVIVAVGDLGWLEEVKEASPDTITLGRLLEDGQTIAGDPVVRAREFVYMNAGQYLANPGVDYWLGWNEPDIGDPGQMGWYAAFEAERTIAMAELGLRVAVGNFSTGTPEAAEFEAFLPALSVAREYSAVLALHEYSAPTMFDGVGADIPGHEAQDGFGALTLRYRYWYEHYLEPNGLVLPLVITEAGIDGGVLRPQGIVLDGWREFASDPPEGVPALTLESYIDQLTWYDSELRRDPYVLGFAIFNVGESDGQWASFDVTAILPYLAGVIEATAN